MKRILILHLILVSLIVLCAFSPWLLLMIAFTVGGVFGEQVENLGLGIGYIGMAVTPLGLLTAGFYVVGAILYHVVVTWLGKKPMPSFDRYLVGWFAMLIVGAIGGFTLLTVPQVLQQWANRPIQANCSDLVRQPVVTQWQVGQLALGWRAFDAASGQVRSGVALLNSKDDLARNIELTQKVFALDWSPDGRQIVFSDEFNLFILDIETGEARPLTSFDREENRRLEKPAWGKDGRTIYFAWQAQGEAGVNLEIFAIQTDGSGLRQLTDAEGYSFDLALSPDGQQIAFVSSRLSEPNLYMMDTDGGNVRRLSEHPGLDNAPTWSPDGRWLAFLSNRLGDWNIFLISVESGETCLLVSADVQVSHMTWSPDGQWIYYIDSQNNALKAVRPDSRGLRDVFQDASLGTLRSPSFSISP
jgi:Tol biopolymer transport system component